MTQDATRSSSGGFWDFSLAIYALTGVPAACLSLQDEYGADVNILLFCAWTGRVRQAALSRADCIHILRETADWRDNVVEPLRCVRRAIKARLGGLPAGSDPYGALKAAELAAEQAQQLALESTCSGLGQPVSQSETADLAVGNMMTYMAVLGQDGDPGVTEAVSVIAGAAAGLTGKPHTAVQGE